MIASGKQEGNVARVVLVALAGLLVLGIASSLWMGVRARNAATNQAVADEAIDFPTESGAREYMRRRIAEDASLADTLHVIPTVERAA